MPRRSTWTGLCLIAITCLVFGRACMYDFTIWDDNEAVWNSPLLNPPSLEHTLVFWKQTYLSLYLPVTCTVWAVVAAAGWSDQPDGWGNHLNPYLFHGLNLLLHVACVLVVWRLVRRLVGSDLPAAMGALIFALHPVQVETVAWVTATRDLLGMLFSMLAVLIYLDFRDSANSGQSVGWAYSPTDRSLTKPATVGEYAHPTRSVVRRIKPAIATVLFLLAILSKPTAVVTPVLAALLALWQPRKWLRGDWALLGFWLLIGAADALANRVSQQVDPFIMRSQPGLAFRPMIALDALAFYAGKLLWPFQLAIDYGHTPIWLMQSGQWRWTWLVPVTVTAILLKLGRRQALCGALFMVGLLPTLGLTPYRYQVYYGTVADRYLYPAMFGVALAVALALANIGTRWRNIAMVAALAVLVSLATLSFRQLNFWRDSMTLFTHAIDVNPHTFAGHRNRGVVELHDGNVTAALSDYQKVIVIDPAAPEGYRGLARAHLALMQVDEALADWTKALEMEERTIDQHGDLSADYRRALAGSYAEAAAVAASVNRPDLAARWQARARR